MGTSDEEIDRLLGKLTPRARALLLNGATTWRTRAEPAVELRELVMSDGPAGVRGEAWDERSTSLLLPSASALAATWDEALVEDLGGLLAAEARRKGVDVLLAPTLNLHRSPLGGRHFECLSEDPELTGRIGAALVRGIQAHGVAATAKHYVANDSETDRLTVDVRVGERALREVYLAPFEAAVAAGVRLVMAGYNAVNGTTMTANALLTDPLKSEWGFDGVVVSDWGAVRGTTGTARAGLDLAMPGPDGPWGEALARAVAEGAVPEPAVDDKARRLLRLAAWLGALGGRDVSRSPVPGRPADSPGAEGADGGAGAGPSSGAEGLPGRGPAHGAKPSGPRPRRAGDGRALARRAVAAGAVLLANKDVLPLDPEHLGTVAVIGAHAARTRTQGGGSAGVFPRARCPSSTASGPNCAAGPASCTSRAPGRTAPRPHWTRTPAPTRARGCPASCCGCSTRTAASCTPNGAAAGACWSPAWCRARTPSRSAPGCVPAPAAPGPWAWPGSAG